MPSIINKIRLPHSPSASKHNSYSGTLGSLDSGFSSIDEGDLADQISFAERGLLEDSDKEFTPIKKKKHRVNNLKKNITSSYFNQKDSTAEEVDFSKSVQDLPISGNPRRSRRRQLESFDVIIPSPEIIAPNRYLKLFYRYFFCGTRNKSEMVGLSGKPLLYFTSVFVSLGVFLFGYDQGVISGLITGPYFKDYFHQPSRSELGTMVAILEVGAFFSSLAVGKIGDMIGRRKTIFYGAVIFVIGGAFQTLSWAMYVMIVGRIISGVGVGLLSTIVPVYQSEISPPHNRGKLACIEFTGNIVGYATSVWVDYFCSYIQGNMSWRIPLALQCVMGSLLAIGSLVISESPRWLLDNDHDESGMIVLAMLHGGGDVNHPKARDEYREIKKDILIRRTEGERTYSEMFRRYWKRLLIAMSSQMFAQLNGINVISYYAPLVFEQAGWVGRDAILMTGINSIIYVLSTVPP